MRGPLNATRIAWRDAGADGGLKLSPICSQSARRSARRGYRCPMEDGFAMARVTSRFNASDQSILANRAHGVGVLTLLGAVR
jgi:hypothetical protein